MPPLCVQRNACSPVDELLYPTTVAPSLLIPVAVLSANGFGGAKYPSPTIPPDVVHRNASYVEMSRERLRPTMMEPSEDVRTASLKKGPPGNSPRPSMPPD